MMCLFVPLAWMGDGPDLAHPEHGSSAGDFFRGQDSFDNEFSMGWPDCSCSGGRELWMEDDDA